METPSELTKLRPTWPAIVVAIVGALLLGGTAGYNLKPWTVVGTTEHASAANSPQMNVRDEACVWFGRHKGC